MSAISELKTFCLGPLSAVEIHAIELGPSKKACLCCNREIEPEDEERSILWDITDDSVWACNTPDDMADDYELNWWPIHKACYNAVLKFYPMAGPKEDSNGTHS